MSGETCRCGHKFSSHESRGCLSCRCQRFRAERAAAPAEAREEGPTDG